MVGTGAYSIRTKHCQDLTTDAETRVKLSRGKELATLHPLDEGARGVAPDVPDIIGLGIVHQNVSFKS
jgi:hypothetical protein